MELKHRFLIDYLTHDHLAIMSVDVIVHIVSIVRVIMSLEMDAFQSVL